MKKYAILCINRGMWGGMRSLMQRDGKVIYFNSKAEAQQRVDEIRKNQGRVNNFNEYFVKEIEEGEVWT